MAARCRLLLLLVAIACCSMALLKASSCSTSSSSSILEYSAEDLLSESRLMALFDRWNAKHGKSYYNSEGGLGFGSMRQDEEKRRRYEIFKQNLGHIDEHNAQKGKAYRLGLTRFADMTNEEFKASKWLGLRLNNTRSVIRSNLWREYGKQAEKSCNSSNTVKETPSSLDWRKRGIVSPIKDQGGCGSCWAFATISAVESVNAIATGELVRLSEQELVGCDNLNYGCEGGDMDLALEWIIKNGGVDTEEDYPYTSSEGVTGDCRYNLLSNRAVSIDSYADVSSYDEDALLCVASQQPVIVAINGGAYDFQLYAEGVFDGDCPGEPDDLDHAVVIEGYGSSSETEGLDYWIVRNSWGTSWGSDGYVYMARNTGSQQGICGINSEPSYPIKLSSTPTVVVSETPTPSPQPGGDPSPASPPPPPPSPPSPGTKCNAYSSCGPHQTCCCTFSLFNLCLIWGCCDYESAVCCTQGAACCPSDYPVCDLQHDLCLKDPGPTAFANGVPLKKLMRPKFDNPLGFDDLLMPFA